MVRVSCVAGIDARRGAASDVWQWTGQVTSWCWPVAIKGMTSSAEYGDHNTLLDCLRCFLARIYSITPLTFEHSLITTLTSVIKVGVELYLRAATALGAT